MHLFQRMLSQFSHFSHGFPILFFPDKQRPELDPGFPAWRLQISDSVIVSEKQINSFGKEHLVHYI